VSKTSSLLTKKLKAPVDYLFWRSHASFIVENISAAIVAVDTHGDITVFNNKAEAVFQKPALDVLGQPFSKIFPNIPDHEQYLLHVLKTGRELKEKESTYCPYTHREGIFSHTVSLVKGAHGEVGGSIWMRKDLTCERRFQKEVNNAEVQAIVSQIAAGTAHEIRNPLTTAKGYIQLAQSRCANNPVVVDYLGMAVEEIEQINGILSDLLALIHPNEEGLQFTCLNMTVNDLLHLVENVGMMVDIEIISELDKNIPLCLFDQKQIKQAILNVLRNAIQAMPDCGRLTVKTKYLSEMGQVCISVCDTGHGIREEDIARIFTPFYSTKVEGSGLGLTLTNRIIQHHDGWVEITSKENKGTRVDMYLPLCKE
jgi:two-component system sensor histidine kinase AtoS